MIWKIALFIICTLCGGNNGQIFNVTVKPGCSTAHWASVEFIVYNSTQWTIMDRSCYRAHGAAVSRAHGAAVSRAFCRWNERSKLVVKDEERNTTWSWPIYDPGYSFLKVEVGYGQDKDNVTGDWKDTLTYYTKVICTALVCPALLVQTLFRITG